MKKILLLLPVAFLLAAGCNKNAVTNNYDSPTPIADSQMSSNPATPEQPSFVPQFPNTDRNGLVIAPQKSHSEVVVDQYYLEKPGFIVAHEIERDSPAKVAGVSPWLDKGLGKNLKFAAVLPSHVYFGLLYEDDGDKKFDISKDKLLPLYSGPPASYYNDRFVAQFLVE